jgi:cell division protein FtsZ
VNEAAEAVREAATDDTNIIFGATIDERLSGQLWITVVATGLGGPQRRSLVGAGRGEELFAPPSFLQSSTFGTVRRERDTAERLS